MIGKDPDLSSMKKCWLLAKWLFRPSILAAYIGLVIFTADKNGGLNLMSVLSLFRMFTLINVAVNAVYFFLAIILDLLTLKNARTTLSITAFTSSLVVSVLYWGIELTRKGSLNAGLNSMPEWWTHTVHTLPPIAMVMDMMLAKPGKPNFKVAFGIILTSAFAYALFLDICANREVYIYAILKDLSEVDRIKLYSIALGVIFVCFAVVSSIAFLLYQLSKRFSSGCEYYGKEDSDASNYKPWNLSKKPQPNAENNNSVAEERLERKKSPEKPVNKASGDESQDLPDTQIR